MKRTLQAALCAQPGRGWPAAWQPALMQRMLLSPVPFHEEAALWPAVEASAGVAEELLGVGDLLPDWLDAWGASPPGAESGAAPAPAPALQRCLDATHAADCNRRAPHGCRASAPGLHDLIPSTTLQVLAGPVRL